MREAGVAAFGAWFERMGYARPGGEEECAERLDITMDQVCLR